MTLFTDNPFEKMTVRRPFQNPRRVCVALIRRNPPVSAIV